MFVKSVCIVSWALLVGSSLPASTIFSTEAIAKIGFNGLYSCNQDAAVSASCNSDGSSSSANVLTGTGGLAEAAAGPNLFYGAAGAESLFGFELIGPKGVNVPVFINGSTVTEPATEAGVGGDIAGVSLLASNSLEPQVLAAFTTPVPDVKCVYGPNDLPCLASGGKFTIKDALQSDTFYILIASAAAVFPGETAEIDPTIEIDPSSSQAGEFTVEAAPGVLTSSPEPETIGFIGLAFVLFISQRRFC